MVVWTVNGFAVVVIGMGVATTGVVIGMMGVATMLAVLHNQCQAVTYAVIMNGTMALVGMGMATMPNMICAQCRKRRAALSAQAQ
jgi:hypothetical protein